MPSNAEKLATSLDSDNVTVVQHNDFKKRVQLLFRVAKIKKFLPIIDLILTEEERQGEDGGEHRWNVDISRVYMRYNGRLIYAWRMVLKGKTVALTEAVNEVRRLLDLANRMNFQDVDERPKKKGKVSLPSDNGAEGDHADGTMIDGEVMEMPLVGMDSSRNKPQAPILTSGVRGMGKRSGVSSKGAHLIGPTKEQY